MTEQRTYPKGVPSWVDVETGDIETTFYGCLLGWTFVEATPPDAVRVCLDTDWTREATIVDPHGAEFTISQFPA